MGRTAAFHESSNKSAERELPPGNRSPTKQGNPKRLVDELHRVAHHRGCPLGEEQRIPRPELLLQRDALSRNFDLREICPI